jgi:lipopolysaccharide transport system ATP-binding protein
MSQPIISVHNIGKRYKLGATHGGRSYKTMRDAMANVIKAPIRLFSKSINKPEKNILENNYFWALKDISFDVQQGEVLGIIGRNGAGKSTMLKILSQITDPTEGEVRIRGRVASLLEVGTGFHPELTGRENVYLNGAILGMHRSEIKKKFAEIVEFAGVEKFLDTPVKRFSSGMYVRLAFAVAAHLEPEILIVDEVLAVGDAEFQKKCLGKMQAVSGEGRTVIFVSHNMGAIESLCQKVIVLEKGEKVFSGATRDGIDFYLKNSIKIDCTTDLLERKDRIGNGKVRVKEFTILDKSGSRTSQLLSGETYLFRIDYKNYCGENIEKVVVSIDIHDEKDHRWLMLRSNFTNNSFLLEKENGFIECILDKFPLTIGNYHFTLFLSYADAETLDCIGNVYYFNVVGGDFFGTGNVGMPHHCKILTKAEWIC